MSDHLTDLLRDDSLRVQIRKIMVGLKAPHESGDYKYAIYALERIFGPSSISIVLSALIVVAAVTFTVGTGTATRETSFEVTMMTPETVKLDDVKVEEVKVEEIKPDEVEPIKPDDADMAPPGAVSAPGPGGPATDYSSPADSPGSGVGGNEDAPTVPFAAILTKSPVTFKGLYANRSKGGREVALRLYGGGGAGGSGRGGFKTEDAVLRALRWLKRTQKENGSWEGAEASAMTGFALLCYLAHGETPSSTEFGPTVEKAVKFLIGVQGDKKAFSGNAYAHGIASYAMCEAFAMTKNMAIKECAEKGLQVVLDGQQDPGGFNYGYEKKDRWDTSVCGWQYQAMKAGKMAGCQVEGVDRAIQKGATFLKTISFNPANGSFSYSGNGPNVGPGGSWTMTGVGVLCLQLMGYAKDPEVKAGQQFLDPQVMQWKKGPEAKNAVYGWYYLTQAKFQEGGTRWEEWNKVFSKELVNNQLEDGHWEGGDHDKEVYTTCLCCLMLEVYYRYLPTYKKIEDAAPAKSGSDDDVVVEVSG